MRALGALLICLPKRATVHPCWDVSAFAHPAVRTYAGVDLLPTSTYASETLSLAGVGKSRWRDREPRWRGSLAGMGSGHAGEDFLVSVGSSLAGEGGGQSLMWPFT